MRSVINSNVERKLAPCTTLKARIKAVSIQQRRIQVAGIWFSVLAAQKGDFIVVVFGWVRVNEWHRQEANP